MIWLIIAFLIICCLFLLAHLFLIRKEIKNIISQLKDYNSNKTRKNIDITLLNKELEELACSINDNMDRNLEAQVKQKQAEEQLKKAIANISHDLRTPLTSIIGYIQMIKSKELPKVVESEYINIVEAQAKSIQVLLSDFFELSVIETPEYELQIEAINLNSILCEVITSFYEGFIEKNIKPEINMPKESILVLGNKVATRRVIENLIANIVKHSEGQVFINLEAEKDGAVLTTINSAKNLEHSDVDLIFNRFYKGDNSRSANNTGLGLTIAKSLMDKMKGIIYAEYNEGLLSIFCKWKIKK
ncbi:sensor histidine kinase [Desnuesiella massiliensis]|uniref:sensor histidine kinase n=1 Tax=Desnuesiella massiliensis TaxID=1650662 RepID=UPI0006E3B79C|nr:HAMP domain-containing sensor histidine kinase [Desnuesiella massiliensis]